MNFGHVFYILELFLLISQFGFSSSQVHLSGVHDGQVHLFDRSRQTVQPNMLAPDAHVDLPGEHGNRSPHPVIHRHSESGSHASNIAHSPHHRKNLHMTSLNNMASGLSAAHIDLPGQHGNESPFPTIHRQTGPHVDLPGQNGNESPFPAVHRQTDPHVDLPGQHGNESPFPTVHRQTGPHVDLPGQHGNESPFPIIHRQTGPHVDLLGQHSNESPFPTVHRQPTPHVDLPGQHGNESPFPIIHRQSGSHVNLPGVPHVDLPGEHGNESPFPTVHRHSGSHVDISGQHDNVSPLQAVQSAAHASDHHHHALQDTGARGQSFLDPVSGSPVIISAPRGRVPRLPNDHIDAPNLAVHTHSLAPTRGTRPASVSRVIPQPPVERPPVLPVLPMPIGVPFPILRGIGRPFGGPLLPVPLGPPPFIIQPEVSRMGRYRGHMHRPFIMSRLPPHLLPPPPPSSQPRRLRLGTLLVGIIGSLLSNTSRS